MPRKSDGEKIDELEKLAAVLRERVDRALEQLEVLHKAWSDASGSHADLRRDYERELALLKREIEELRKWREEQKRAGEERGRRLWAFGPNLVAALISGIIAAVVAYFVKRP